MRVLWVVHNLAYPPVRGVLLRNFNLLREAAKGVELHVLAFDQPASRPPGVSADACAEALGNFCESVDWLPISAGAIKNRHWLGIKGLLTNQAYDMTWMYSPEMAAKLIRKLDATPFDAVHFDTIGLAQYRRHAAGIGTVLNHHNVESSMMQQRAEKESRFVPHMYWRMEASKLRGAERKFCPQFASNLVVSAEDGQVLESLAPGSRSTVVANGVDTDFFTPRPDPGGKRLLFCGGLDWYPNGEAMEFFFRDIWPLLAARDSEISVTVVGRNPPDWLVRLGQADRRVSVTGFVDDVRPYFHEATLYFCPIRSGGGTRLKILDALAMGMPLIGTTFACSGLALEDDRHVLLADTPEAFANRIHQALADPQLRVRIAGEGRAHMERNFSWAFVGKKLVAAYADAASMAAREKK